jgi:hypothetical protein
MGAPKTITILSQVSLRADEATGDGPNLVSTWKAISGPRYGHVYTAKVTREEAEDWDTLLAAVTRQLPPGQFQLNKPPGNPRVPPVRPPDRPKVPPVTIQVGSGAVVIDGSEVRETPRWRASQLLVQRGPNCLRIRLSWLFCAGWVGFCLALGFVLLWQSTLVGVLMWLAVSCLSVCTLVVEIIFGTVRFDRDSKLVTFPRHEAISQLITSLFVFVVVESLASFLIVPVELTFRTVLGFFLGLVGFLISFHRIVDAFRRYRLPNQRPLTDVIAVQLLRVGYSRSCQLNLVLDDIQEPRMNLIVRSSVSRIRQEGNQLAEFLGVPLVDQIPKDQRTES